MAGAAQVDHTSSDVSLATPSEIEQFLYREARLLDQWKLTEWLGMFAEGARYEVPSAGARDDVSPDATLFYISDSWSRLKQRVIRLNKQSAHSEQPRSTTCHLISNVEHMGVANGDMEVRSVFITYRSKGETQDVYMGHHRYLLRATPDGLKITYKRSTLDMVSLRPQGRVSIIV